MNWTSIHLILWKPETQGNHSLLGSLFGFLGCFRLSCFLNFAIIFLNFPGLLIFEFDLIFTLDVLLLFTGQWFFHNLVGGMDLQLCIAYMYGVATFECLVIVLYHYWWHQFLDGLKMIFNGVKRHVYIIKRWYLHC